MTNRCPKCNLLITNGVTCPKCGTNIMDLIEPPEPEPFSGAAGADFSGVSGNYNNARQYSYQPNQAQAPVESYRKKRKRAFPNLRVFLIIVTILCFLGGISCIFLAVNIISNNSENAYEDNDAYNYVINGNYFTAYTAASTVMFICGALSIASLIFISVKEKELEKIDYQNAKLANIELLLAQNQEVFKNTYYDNVDTSIILE